MEIPVVQELLTCLAILFIQFLLKNTSKLKINERKQEKVSD